MEVSVVGCDLMNKCGHIRGGLGDNYYGKVLGCGCFKVEVHFFTSLNLLLCHSLNAQLYIQPEIKFSLPKVEFSVSNGCSTVMWIMDISVDITLLKDVL